MPRVNTRKRQGHVNRESSSRSEAWWRDHYDAIKLYGYQLPPWYSPDLVPSRNDLGGDFARDVPLQGTMDATRLHDHKRVTLKPKERSHEPDIMFSPEEVERNPRNHCVPLLEIIEIPDSGQRIMVLPYLQHLGDFQTFAEFVEFFTQICEGLQFLHERNIAHRNLTANSIMFDPSGSDPEGSRATQYNQSQDLRGGTERHTWTQRLPRYYLIDCGLARHYASRDDLDEPLRGGNSAAPEHVSENHCNPFHTDVYYLGNLIHLSFIEKYTGFEFMQELVSEMTQSDPTKRPLIENVIDRFASIRESLNESYLRSTITSKRVSWLFTAFRNTWQAINTCICPDANSTL